MLKNWRSHLESKINFSIGTNVLVGIVGSGKTSVLDAICFALFGTTPNLLSKKIKLDDIIMRKPTEKNKTEVEVYFQINGDTYSVKRIIEKRKGTTYSEIRENGKLIESPNSQRVTEIVEKTLKIDYELFSKAIYSEQNALDYFLTIPRGLRMKKIDELLMIDKFEKARGSAVTLTNRLIERKIGKQSIIDQVNIEELKKNISEIKKSLDQIISEKNQLSKEFDEITSEKTGLDKETVELQRLKERLEVLRIEEKGFNSAIEETKKSIESLEEALKGQTKEKIEKNLSELKQNIKKLEKSLKEKQNKYEKINSLASESKAKIDFIKNEKIERLEKEFEEKLKIKDGIKNFEKEIGKDAEKQLEKTRSLYENLLGNILEINAKIKEYDEIVNQLSFVNKCPVCESELNEDKKYSLIEKKQNQINTMNKKLEKLKKEKELSEKEIKRLQDAIKNFEKMIIQIKDFDKIADELEKSRKTFRDLSEQAIKNDNQLSKLRKEIGEIEVKLRDSIEKKQKFEILDVKQKDYQERKRRFDELDKERKETEQKISETEQKIAGRDLTKLEKRLKLLIAKHKELETKVKSFDQLIKEKESRKKEYETKLDEVTKQVKDVQRLEKTIRDLRIFGKALEQTQIELRTDFVGAVNYTMNKLWSALYPYQDFAEIGLSVEEGDYVLQLRSKWGSWVNVEGVASGGERSIACLALRIAFSLVLAPQLKILVLDEPTHNLDEKSVESLAMTLKERIGEFIDQLFIISHDSKIEDAITGNAYRLERDKIKDGVTKVIPIS